MSIPSINPPNELGYVQSFVKGLDMEEESFQASFGGTTASPQNVTIQVLRIGKLVWLTIPAFNATATSSSYFLAAGALPLKFRPVLQTNKILPVNSGGSEVSGMLTISANGNLALYAGLNNNNFGNGQIAGNATPQVVSYALFQ